MQKYKLWLLILIGTLTWSITMIKSGLVYDFGMGFWGANGHDGIWHVALIESLSRGTLDMPILAGETLKNYHYGFDILVAGLHVITRIPAVNLYFQVIPPIFALAIGLLTYKLTKNNWAVFFVYFGGSWAWILGKGESAFWSQQALTTLINPPFALSIICLLVMLMLLRKKHYLLASLVFAILPHVKIYAGLLALVGLIVATVKDKKIIITLLVGLALYFISNPQVLTYQSQLIWQPGWFLETMMAVSDRINWPRYYSALINYRLDHNWPKLALAYFVAFLIFWFGNMGTRFVKEIFILKKLKSFRDLSSQDLFIWTVIIAGGVVPMFFLQKGTAWNTIQFFYYSLFFSSLIAGESMTDILKNWKLKNSLRFVFCALVIVFTIPTTVISLKDIYLPSRPPAMVSTLELEALTFLSSQERGVVLTPLAMPNSYAQAPRPLYLYESTAYVSALSGQPVYLEDEVNLNITDYSWQDRKVKTAQFFAQKDQVAAQGFLEENNISYIYIPDIKNNRPFFSESQLGLVNIFENPQAAVWKKL
ncbi:MAG: hypothetical protein AAB909_04380 [Patescibacteria group bacterium]